MKLIDAIKESSVYCASYVNRNGIQWNVDGSGDVWYVTSGVEGMPPTDTKEFENRDEAIASLPERVANSDKWEVVESE